MNEEGLETPVDEVVGEDVLLDSVPSTPPSVFPDNDEVGEMAEVVVSGEVGARKSGRARKPRKVVEAPMTEPTIKKESKKRKSVAVSKSEDASANIAVKKVRKSAKISIPAPTIVADNNTAAAYLSAPIAAVTDTAPLPVGDDGIILLPAAVVKEAKERKIKPADVPPIEGLPASWFKKRVKHAKKEPHVVISEVADIPPPVPADMCSHDVLVLPPVPEVAVVEDAVMGEPAVVNSPDQGEKKSKKNDKKATTNQPSVMSFFARPVMAEVSAEGGVDPQSAQDSREGMIRTPDKAKAVVDAKPAVACTVVDEPTFAMYKDSWMCSRQTSSRVRGRTFVQKSGVRSETVRRLGFLEIVRVASRKSNVFAGENLNSRKRLRQPRSVYIAIHDRERPPVKLIVTHTSLVVDRRHPLATDQMIDYEKDSDEEYEEEKEGEDINAADEEDEEDAVGEADSDVDSFFVSDGHFSDDEALSDDEAVVARRRKQESPMDTDGKTTLQLITFSPADLENLSTQDFGPQQPDHAKWLQALRTECVVTVLDAEHYFVNPAVAAESEKRAAAAALSKKMERTPKQEKPEKLVIDWVSIRPSLARFVHGKVSNIDGLAGEFRADRPELSNNGIKTEIRTIAAWTKRPEFNSRIAWYVKPELFTELGLTEEEMVALVNERKVVAAATVPPATAADPTNALSSAIGVFKFKPVVSVPIDLLAQDEEEMAESDNRKEEFMDDAESRGVIRN